MGELKSSRSIEGKDSPNFEMLGARIASALNKIIKNSTSRRRSVSRTESSEGGPVSTREKDRLHDLRLLSSHWRS